MSRVTDAQHQVIGVRLDGSKVGGSLAGAVVLVAGTLVEDFFTAGAGTVDDPASFALSSAAVLRGLQLLRGATVVLPAVAVPGAVSLSFGVTAPSGSIGASH